MGSANSLHASALYSDYNERLRLIHRKIASYYLYHFLKRKKHFLKEKFFKIPQKFLLRYCFMGSLGFLKIKIAQYHQQI